MDDKIIPFKPQPSSKLRTLKKKPLSIVDVEQIGFLTTTDRDMWIEKKEDVLKIMLFIIKENITILEEE